MFKSDMTWWNVCLYIYIYIYILHYSNMTEALVSGTSSLRRFSAWIRDAHRQGFQGHRGGEFLYAAGGLLEAEFLVLMCWVGGIYRYVYLLRIYIYMFIMYVYVYSFRFVFVWYIQFILNIYIFLFIYFWIYIYIFLYTYPGLIIAYQYPLPSWVYWTFVAWEHHGTCRRNYITWKGSMAQNSHVLVCHGSLLSHLFGIVPSTFTTV